MGGTIIFNIAKRYPFWALLRPYRWRVLVGIGALVLVDLVNVALPLEIRDAIDAVTAKNPSSLRSAGLTILLMVCFQSIMRYAWRWYLIGTSHYVARDVRQRLYEHLQEVPIAYYHKVRTGDLMSRATNDVEAIRMAVGPGILVAADALILFTMMVPVMFSLSPKLTLYALALFPIVPLVTRKLGDRIDALFESTQKKMSRLSGYAQEVMRAIRLVKSLVLEGPSVAKFSAFSLDYRAESFRLAKYQAVFSPSLTLITALGTFLILLAGGLDVITGAITVGTFVAFQRFVVQLTWPMEAIGWAVTLYREGFAAYRRLDEVLSVPRVTSIRSTEEVAAINGEPLLEISNLRFRYEEHGSAFSLAIDGARVDRGKKIGIAGPVGSGKTTLFDLLVRLHEPPLGSVRLAGTDVAAIPLARLRTRIVSVEQQVFLFSEPIRENIALGAVIPIGEHEMRHSTEVASIHEEIEGLEAAYDTRLGERGVNLSGGQKQRLALSRALARRPEVLLLDDCFSAVDVEVEARIIERLFREHPSMSFLIATHRLSIMPRLDEIWVLDRGRIVDRGTHAELLDRCGLYRDLWHRRSGTPADGKEAVAT